MNAIALLLLASLSFAGDADPKQVDTGLYATSAGVAYLPTATDKGWYVEALDRSGTLLLDKAIVGSDLSEADAVRIAMAAQQAKGPVIRVALASGEKVAVNVGKEELAVIHGE